MSLVIKPSESCNEKFGPGKNGPGRPFLVDKIWSWGTKFGCQNPSSPTKNGQVYRIYSYHGHLLKVVWPHFKFMYSIVEP